MGNDSDKPEPEVVSVINLLSEKPEETKTNENNKSLDNAVAKKEKKKSVNKAHQPTENKESITQVEDNQNAKENNSKVSKNLAKIDKNQENKSLVVDLDLLDPKLFSSLQDSSENN